MCSAQVTPPPPAPTLSPHGESEYRYMYTPPPPPPRFTEGRGGRENHSHGLAGRCGAVLGLCWVVLVLYNTGLCELCSAVLGRNGSAGIGLGCAGVGRPGLRGAGGWCWAWSGLGWGRGPGLGWAGICVVGRGGRERSGLVWPGWSRAGVGAASGSHGMFFFIVATLGLKQPRCSK